jgi:hypothetical protein
MTLDEVLHMGRQLAALVGAPLAGLSRDIVLKRRAPIPRRC